MENTSSHSNSSNSGDIETKKWQRLGENWKKDLQELNYKVPLRFVGEGETLLKENEYIDRPLSEIAGPNFLKVKDVNSSKGMGLNPYGYRDGTKYKKAQDRKSSYEFGFDDKIIDLPESSKNWHNGPVKPNQRNSSRGYYSEENIWDEVPDRITKMFDFERY